MANPRLNCRTKKVGARFVGLWFDAMDLCVACEARDEVVSDEECVAWFGNAQIEHSRCETRLSGSTGSSVQSLQLLSLFES